MKTAVDKVGLGKKRVIASIAYDVGNDVNYANHLTPGRQSKPACNYPQVWCGELIQPSVLVLFDGDRSCFVLWHQMIEVRTWDRIGRERKLSDAIWVMPG